MIEFLGISLQWYFNEPKPRSIYSYSDESLQCFLVGKNKINLWSSVGTCKISPIPNSPDLHTA